MTTGLPLPPFYDPAQVLDDTRWIDYPSLQAAAPVWRADHGIKLATADRAKVGLLAVDVQNTFCHPRGELFVSGATGQEAIDDTRRLVEFVYRNLGTLSSIVCTLDTHLAHAVFHPSSLIDRTGRHPAPYTTISAQDVRTGTWRPSPEWMAALGLTPVTAGVHLSAYTTELAQRGRYQLEVWPYHAMLGDKGHNLASGLAEAVTFHALVRGAQTGLVTKGSNLFVEHYSALGPEVTALADGRQIPRETDLIEKLLGFDVLVIAGEAKSHCLAWTIDDLLAEITTRDPALASRVYLLEDCTSAIVVKDETGAVVYDYRPEADAAFDRFREAGMHVVRSTDPMADWPDLRL